MKAVLFVWPILAVIFIAVGIPLILRKVPPNYWYGWRTPSTLKDPDIWYPVNKLTGVWMVVIGSVLGVVASAGYAGILDRELAGRICLGILLGGIAAMCIECFVTERRLVKQKRDKQA